MTSQTKLLSFELPDYGEAQLRSEDERQGTKRCFKCRFWEENYHPPVGHRESAGFCRKRAPSVAFAQTRASEFCFEFVRHVAFRLMARQAKSVEGPYPADLRRELMEASGRWRDHHEHPSSLT